jgi:hypothetical protein
MPNLLKLLTIALIVAGAACISACQSAPHSPTTPKTAMNTPEAIDDEISEAAEAFAELSKLVGNWEGTYADRTTHQINYRLSAGGTVLVETWTLSPTRESITIYSIDGDRLIAQHFCPQGNQPRLELKHGNTDEGYYFEFFDGTGLQDPKGSHQHVMWIKPGQNDFIERSETYIPNQTTELPKGLPEVVVYQRLTR